MSDDVWNPWHQVDAANAREQARRFWDAPGMFARQPHEWINGMPAPPQWPPGSRVIHSTCMACPYGACPDCACRAAWQAYLNPTPPRRSWWQRLMTHLRQGATQ